MHESRTNASVLIRSWCRFGSGDENKTSVEVIKISMSRNNAECNTQQARDPRAVP